MKTLLLGKGVVSLDDVCPYQSIDFAPEAAFDDLTRLAACMCQTPIALLCLIDARRRWVKSHVGLESRSSEAYLALCSETLLQPERWDSRVLIFEDASADQRFASFELVKSQAKIRLYACAPLVTPQGVVLGTLSVIDRVPRSLTLEQQEALVLLSQQAIAQLELRKSSTNPEKIASKRQQSEEVRQVSHQELAAIELALERTAMVAITDYRGKIKYVNNKLCEISKYSREELLGQEHRIVNSLYHSSDFFKQMWMTIHKGKVWKGEIKNRAKDGSFYWVNTAIVPLLNERGKLYEYVSICQDITLAKQAEEKRLTQASREADHFLELSPDLMCIVGLDGYFHRVNPAFEKILSHTPEELLSKSFLDFVHPEDKATTQTEWEKLTSNRATICVENRYQCRDGSYKWLEWNLFGSSKENVVYGIARELTRRKPQKAILLERGAFRAALKEHVSTLEADVSIALGESATLSESLKRCTEAIVQHLDAIGAGIWTVDSEAVGSDEPLPMDLQASAGQLLPADIFPHHIPPNRHLIGTIAQTRQPLSSKLHSPTKSNVKRQSSKGWIGATSRAEEEVFTNISSPVLSKASTSAATNFSGYPLIVESRLVGVMALHTRQPFSKVVHNVLVWVADAIALAIDRAWTREELVSRREALLCRLAHQIRSSHDLDAILTTAVTEIRSLLGVDCCHFLWCFCEPDRPSLIVTHEARNPDLPSLLGESPPPYLEPLAEIIRKSQTLRIDDVTQVGAGLQRTAKTEENSGEPAFTLEPEMPALLTNWGITSGLLLPLKTHTGQLGAIVCSHYNGSHQWSDREVELLQAVVDQLAIAIEQAELFANTRAATLAAQTQAHRLEVALKDLQQTEAWLIQSEKMSGLGQMLAGVAHEINNPVNFITGNLSHAANYIQDLLELINYYQQHYPTPLPEIQEFIEEIDLEFLIEDLPKIFSSMKMGADRIHEIVLSLRNFSRTDDAEMKPIDIHEGIDSTLLILHNRLKPRGHHPGIAIVKEYSNLPLVECYVGQLNQVFMNIISNAIDALESWLVEQGKQASEQELTASPEHPVNPSPTIWIGTEIVEENQVMIRIRDNGPGMTQSVISRLFDPFFTTKPVGKGTGLGLSISYQIVVDKHGGSLKCISEPGQGAEFQISIPISPSSGSRE